MNTDSSANRSERTDHTDALQRVFLIGAMKAGTSSLFKHLAMHPDICPSTSKEPKYFIKPNPSAEQSRAYQAMFSGRTNETWDLEGCTCSAKYPTYPGVPQRIAAAYPQARFIYMVRDPIDRIWSHYVFSRWKGRERLTFAEAIKTNDTFIEYSQYHLQISQFLTEFPRDRILVLLFEEFLQDKVKTLEKVWDFLGVDANFRPDNLKQVYNSSQGRIAVSPMLRMMRSLPGYNFLPWRVRHRMTFTLGSTPPRKADTLTPAIRSQFLEALRDDVEAFQSFMGRSLDIWPTVRDLNGDSNTQHTPVSKNVLSGQNGSE